MQLCMYRYIHTSPWHPTQQKSSAGHSVRNDATTLAVSFWTVTGHAFQMWCFLHVTWQMLLFQSWSYSQKIKNDSIFNKAMPKKDIVHSDMHPKQMHNTFFRIASLTSGPSRLYISLAFHWHLKVLVFFFRCFVNSNHEKRMTHQNFTDSQLWCVFVEKSPIIIHSNLRPKERHQWYTQWVSWSWDWSP